MSKLWINQASGPDIINVNIMRECLSLDKPLKQTTNLQSISPDRSCSPGMEGCEHHPTVQEGKLSLTKQQTCIPHQPSCHNYGETHLWSNLGPNQEKRHHFKRPTQVPRTMLLHNTTHQMPERLNTKLRQTDPNRHHLHRLFQGIRQGVP